MLNPRQLADTIDRSIARHRASRTVDRRSIADDLLATLSREDRRGITPEILEMIVAARARHVPGSAMDGDGHAATD